ncbi:MAG: hypothetical protein R2912_11420 [Eubacteriales bacterium]
MMADDDAVPAVPDDAATRGQAEAAGIVPFVYHHGIIAIGYLFNVLQGAL